MYDVDRAYSWYGEPGADALGVRDSFRQLADYLVATLPEGREKSLALTNLEQAWHWADTAIGDS